MPDAFADYAVEVTGPTAADRLACRLREHGLATFGGVSDRGAATRLAQQVMDVWPHRDSEPDSVTVVADRGDLSRTPGMAGFGHDGLDLHTESSTVACPPQLMMLVCVTAASEGGACVLADGHLVYQRVSEQQPELLELLCAPRSILFGGASGHLASVFGADDDGRVTVRLRTDALARFSPQLTYRLGELQRMVRDCAITIELRPGQGYMLCNTRWLHGRSAFAGRRRMYRILGNPLPAGPFGTNPASPHARDQDSSFVATKQNG